VKKLYGFMLLVVGALLLTGCTMKTHINLDIAKDGKVTATMLTAYDDEMIDGMLSMQSGDTTSETPAEHTDEERWAFVDSSEQSEAYKDYKKEKYEKDGLKGYTYTKVLGKIEDLVATGDEKAEMDKLAEGSKIFTKEGNTYKLVIEPGEDMDTESAKQYESMGAVFDLKFVVKLPAKAKTHNATEVSKDGLTYTWDLLKAKDIKLEFEMPGEGGLSLPFIIGIACGIVLAVIITCVAVALKKKKSNNVTPSNPTPTEPTNPTAV